MVDDAEERGLLQPGGTIVEATSGNTGVALALIAASRGYRCIVVMPEGYGAVKAKLMTAAGAEVVRTPADAMMAGAVSRAAEIAASTPGSFVPNQFHNPVNPRTHFETTGPEIAEQLGERVDAWVAGVGTTGTFVGVARYLSDSPSRRAARRGRAAGLDPRRRSRRSPRRGGDRALADLADPRPEPDRRGRRRSRTPRPSRPAARSRARRESSRAARPAPPRPALSGSRAASGRARRS